MKLTCEFGARWPCGPCRKCLALTAAACADFDRGVFFGLHDPRGFTPNERKALE